MDDQDLAWEISTGLRVLLQAGREMQTAIARRLGVGVTDVQALDHLVSTTDPLGPVELGLRLGIRSASATVLVDRLEAAGHLRRIRHTDDRRRVTLQPTDTARAEVRQALAPLLGAVTEITARLDDEQARTVCDFLTSVSAAMRDFTERT